MRVLRPSGPLALVLVAACASAKSTTDTPTSAAGEGVGGRETQTRIQSAGGQQAYEFRTIAEAPIPPIDLVSPPGPVFSAVQTVYAEMGLPMTMQNGASRQVGFENVRARGQLGKFPLDLFVNCGSGAMGMANATHYTVTMSMVSEVGAESDSSKQSALRTIIAASARPEGESGNSVRCSTTGKMEQRVAKAVVLKLGMK